jgi:hypothetical protein
VAVPALFMQSTLMTDLTSIGTLFAFVIVSAGVLMLPRIDDNLRGGGFKLPYINGRFIMPVLYGLFLYFFLPRINSAIANLGSDNLQEILFLIYTGVLTALTLLTVIRSYSLIPILGVVFCAYLLIEIPAISWMWFFVWMALGLTIYFSYGYWKSKLVSK